MLVQIVLFDGLGLLDAIVPYEVLTAAGTNSGGGMAVEFVSTAGACLRHTPRLERENNADAVSIL